MIWLTQWLCPERHCSIGFVWDDADMTAAKAAAKGEALYASGLINRYCGICGGDLHVEHGQTAFKNMKEATPALLIYQEANLRAREVLQNKN
jgi:hypothetical protein